MMQKTIQQSQSQITDISFVSLDLLLANHGIHGKGVLLVGVIFDEPRIQVSNNFVRVSFP